MSNYGFDAYVSIYSDAQRSIQPLLEPLGIITVPTAIDSECYKEMVWALTLGRIMHPEKPLRLNISGYGGDADLAFAIVSLIENDGNIEGHLLGGAHSSHGLIWAACQKRVVHTYGILGIHSIQEAPMLDANTSKIYRQMLKHILPYDKLLAQILSKACSDSEMYSEEFWIKLIEENVTPPLTHTVDADTLINRYEMGVSYSGE